MRDRRETQRDCWGGGLKEREPLGKPRRRREDNIKLIRATESFLERNESNSKRRNSLTTVILTYVKRKRPRDIQHRNNALLRLISTSYFPGTKVCQYFPTFQCTVYDTAISVKLILFLLRQTDIIMIDVVETSRENQSRALRLKTMPQEVISMI